MAELTPSPQVPYECTDLSAKIGLLEAERRLIKGQLWGMHYLTSPGWSTTHTEAKKAAVRRLTSQIAQFRHKLRRAQARRPQPDVPPGVPQCGAV